MTPKPVNQTRNPGYPTRREVLAGAASFVLVGLSGRGLVFAQESGSGAAESGGTIVAPVFEHGEGRGSIGCSAVTPPAFLSEEEGMQILGEELAKHGIELKPGIAFDDVRVPARVEKDVEVVHDDGRKETVRKITEDMKRAVPVKLDGIDPAKNIAVEFITLEDVGTYTKEDQTDADEAEKLFSFQSYDFKDTAERVAAAAKAQGRRGIYLGVFYEPVIMKRPADVQAKADAGDVQPLKDWSEKHYGNMGEARDMLRQQARDFANWLKQQDAIPGGGSQSITGSGTLPP